MLSEQQAVINGNGSGTSVSRQNGTGSDANGNINEKGSGDGKQYTLRTEWGDGEEGVTKLGLNTWRLAALTFFTVSGGPYGLEPLVKHGGPINSLFALLLIPWVWGLPMAMMTAELAAAIPEMGGYVVWVQRTMGDTWAFQNAMWNLFSNCMDNTLYPLLFLDYIEDLVGHDFSFMTRVTVGSLLTITLALVNVVGVDVVGDGAGVFGVMVLLPFIALVLFGLFGGEMNVARWSDTIDEKSISGFVTILLWNGCGYDSAGTCAAEVENPGKTYTNAMLITITLTSFVYVLPIMVGVCYAPQYEEWDDGYFVTVGTLTAGTWLGYWMMIAGSISALGLLNSTICTTSRALASMSSYGYVPTYMSKLHPTYGTPYRAVAANAGAIILLLLTGLDFEAVAELSMWLYAVTLIFEFAALIILRIKEPNLKRPFRIPLTTRGLVIMSVPPCLCCLILIFVSESRTWVICAGILVLSALLLFPYHRVHGRPFKLVIPRKLRSVLVRFGINLNPTVRVSSDDNPDDYHNHGNGPGSPGAASYVTEESRAVELQQRKHKNSKTSTGTENNFTSISLH